MEVPRLMHSNDRRTSFGYLVIQRELIEEQNCLTKATDSDVVESMLSDELSLELLAASTDSIWTISLMRNPTAEIISNPHFIKASGPSNIARISVKTSSLANEYS